MARPKELLLMGRGKEAGASGKPGNPGGDVGRKFDRKSDHFRYVHALQLLLRFVAARKPEEKVFQINLYLA